MLKRNDVEVNGEKFTVMEITVGKMMPILPKLQGTPEEQQDAQLEMMRDCIHKGGKPIGNDVTEMGISTYLKLAEAVMEVNGLDTKGDEGND